MRIKVEGLGPRKRDQSTSVVLELWTQTGDGKQAVLRKKVFTVSELSSDISEITPYGVMWKEENEIYQEGLKTVVWETSCCFMNSGGNGFIEVMSCKSLHTDVCVCAHAYTYTATHLSLSFVTSKPRIKALQCMGENKVSVVRVRRSD